uniref:tenomodulin isoform 3 n=1 Tax=Danio rerio TaxID=7955 RepID=UPI003EB9F631
MESNSYFNSQQVLCKDVELGKEKDRKARYRTYQCAAIILSVVFLILALCIFSLRYIWSPNLGKVTETGEVDMQMVDSQIWIPAEEPISNKTFLSNSKIGEICQDLPIHWIHPSPLRDSEFHDIDDVEETPELEARGPRQARDVMDHLPVNDYSEMGLELDNSLDERGYCCQYCRRGYRYCRRYYEPLGGFWPYPYYYQGGRVICQIVMPCNWWIARMLGRV